MVKFEKEVCEYLNIPSIPLKEWDKKTTFNVGVAILKSIAGNESYGVCRWNDETESEPVVTKVFSQESFVSVEQIFIVPNYMDDKVEDWDVDDVSRKNAKNLVDDVNEMTGGKDEVEKELEDSMKGLPEFYFDEIHNRDEAEAWLRNYYKNNNIRGKVPTKEETIKMRLMVIYSELNPNKK